MFLCVFVLIVFLLFIRLFVVVIIVFEFVPILRSLYQGVNIYCFGIFVFRNILIYSQVFLLTSLAYVFSVRRTFYEAHLCE